MKPRHPQPKLLASPPTIEVAAVSRPAGYIRIRAGRRVLATLHPAETEPLGLQRGDLVTPRLEAALVQAQARSDARRDAIRVINRRAVASEELRRRLTSAGHAPDAVNPVVDSLAAAKALDDSALADAVARASTSRGRAARLTERELESRGIAAPLARQALTRVRAESQTSDILLAIEAARSRLRPSLLAEPWHVRWRRLAAMLARRGHDESTIERALAEVLGPVPQNEQARGQATD